MSDALNPAAIGELPAFLTAPGQTDLLYNVTLLFVILSVIALGVFYLKLHSLPEHLLHGTQKVQLEIVGVLVLISLFTHNHVYWIAALLLAFIDLPDYGTPMNRMAGALEQIAHHSGPDRNEKLNTPLEVPATQQSSMPADDVIKPLRRG